MWKEISTKYPLAYRLMTRGVDSYTKSKYSPDKWIYGLNWGQWLNPNLKLSDWMFQFFNENGIDNDLNKEFTKEVTMSAFKKLENVIAKHKGLI